MVKHQKEREQFIEENIGLVRSVIKGFYNRGHDVEDLFQIGCIGLIKAIKKFDTGFNVKFSTYAVPMIIGEIKRFIRDDGIIKVSRSIKELAIKAMSMKEVMTRENRTEPTVKELAQRMNVSPEELATALEAGARPESIYSTPSENGKAGKALVDRLECRQNYEDEIVNKMLVKKLIDEFDDREKKMCSTEIRQKIVDGTDWKDMVPNAVYEYIVENGLTEKVIKLLEKK